MAVQGGFSATSKSLSAVLKSFLLYELKGLLGHQWLGPRILTLWFLLPRLTCLFMYCCLHPTSSSTHSQWQAQPCTGHPAAGGEWWSKSLCCAPGDSLLLSRFLCIVSPATRDLRTRDSFNTHVKSYQAHGKGTSLDQTSAVWGDIWHSFHLSPIPDNLPGLQRFLSSCSLDLGKAVLPKLLLL